MVESKEVKMEEVASTKKELPMKFNYKKNMVAIAAIDDYEPENVKNALKSLIQLLGIEDYFGGKKIVMKPNVLASASNAFTPTEIQTELIKYLKTEGKAKEIIVADSTLNKTITTRALKASKITERCEAEGVEVHNFFESEREKIALSNPVYEAEEAIYLPKEICDADLVINLPKLKTHTGFVYTGAIKNLLGVLGNKQKMHLKYGEKDMFQKMLADIYFAVEETNETDKPKVLTIMDAVIAMEGKGPQFGKARKVGVMLAGFNSAAIDIVGYSLMNGKPNDLEAIKSVARRTNLPVEISQLDIVGNINYKDYVVKDFKKLNTKLLNRTGYSMKIIPFPNLILKINIKVNDKECTLCKRCVEHCPASAMAIKDEKVVIDKGVCIECYCCGESCPNDAITARWNLFKILPYLIVAIAIGIGAIIWLLVNIFLL